MKASLIISVYKNVQFLKAVLDSLQYQTEKDVEIIIAEDGESVEMKAFIEHIRSTCRINTLPNRMKAGGKIKV